MAKNAEFELVEKKSKFIANAIYIENRLDSENKIKEIKKKYHDARHNCYAYRVMESGGIYEKSSDDGEPSGTAGAPILNILQKNNLCNVLVIVTRYFGGILLGTGGLVRAYCGATIGALENGSKVQIEQGTEYEVQLDYTNFQSFQYYCKKNRINITNTNYEESIICTIEMINKSKEKFLNDIQNQNIIVKQIKEGQTKYIRK